MGFCVELVAGGLNLLHIRVNECLTNGGAFVIFKSDPPHVVQQKLKKYSKDPEYLFRFYLEASAIDGVTGQMVFFSNRIEIQVAEGYYSDDFAEDLGYLFQCILRADDVGLMEESIRVSPKFRPV